jgi:hypothetical protein
MVHTGSRHGKRQTCVKEVDIDVNPASTYRPKCSLKAIEQKHALPQKDRRANAGSMRLTDVIDGYTFIFCISIGVRHAGCEMGK